MFSKFLQNTLGYPLTPEEQHPQQPQQNQQLLPVQLVGRILDLQMQCQEASASPQLVAQLVSLYAQAFDYYERQNNQKCRIYQKRMHLFLSKHSIQSLLKGQKGHLIAKREIVQRKMQHASYSTKEEAQRIINRSEKKVENSRTLVRKQINGQEKNLDQRIKRRKSMSNRSAKTTDNQDLCEDLFLKKGVLPSGNLVFDGLQEHRSKRVFF